MNEKLKPSGLVLCIDVYCGDVWSSERMVGSDLSVSELKLSKRLTRKDGVRKNSKIFLCVEKLKPSGFVLFIFIWFWWCVWKWSERRMAIGSIVTKRYYRKKNGLWGIVYRCI